MLFGRGAGLIFETLCSKHHRPTKRKAKSDRLLTLGSLRSYTTKTAARCVPAPPELMLALVSAEIARNVCGRSRLFPRILSTARTRLMFSFRLAPTPKRLGPLTDTCLVREEPEKK